MTDAAIQPRAGGVAGPVRPALDSGFDPRQAFIFFGLLGVGLLFVAYSLYSDVSATPGVKTTTFLPYLLLFVALLIALGFEFVNGFHDTANAVATVIYTHSMPAQIAVSMVRVIQLSRCAVVERRGRLWHHLAIAGRIDFAGRQRCRVCDGIRAADRADPVEFRYLVSRSAGVEFAYFDRLDHRRRYCQRADARPGRHFGCRLGPGDQSVGKALLFSPIVGFVAAALLLLAMKVLDPETRTLHRAGKQQAAAGWIRGLLIFTCTASALPTARMTGRRAWG